MGMLSTFRVARQAHCFCTLFALALGIALSNHQSATAAQVLIDFGAASTSTTTDGLSRSWNNVNTTNDLTGSPFTLNNTTNLDSGYRLTISNLSGVTNPIGFNGENADGTMSPTGTVVARGYPVSATRDSLFGNTTAFNGSIVQSVRLTLSNLNPNEIYSLAFFASRTGVADNRQTEYLITGGDLPTSIFLNATGNTGNITELTGITPDGNNQIVIDIDPGPSNNNMNGFFYLGVMEINSVAAVPEPTSLGIAGLLLGGLSVVAYRRGR
jgi:hypothetical protein